MVIFIKKISKNMLSYIVIAVCTVSVILLAKGLFYLGTVFITLFNCLRELK